MSRDSEEKSADRAAFELYLRTGQRRTAAEWLAQERKFNPYHDPDNGRFTFAPGGSGSGSSPAAMASRPTNGGKPYPARIDLRNGAKPYPVRANLPAVTPQPTSKPPAAQKSPASQAIRFHYRGGLDLSEPVIAKANALSDSIRSATKYSIVVTSGRRDEHRQAEAMYNNYVEGDPPRYGNHTAERAVHRAFDRGRKASMARGQIISDMTEVLKAQTSRGIFLSPHMRSGAIDIHTPPANVVRAIRNHPSVRSVGVENDHIHIQFH
jgi:hypothetical protein